MQITLTHDEFQSLSEKAREEILEILLYQASDFEPQIIKDKEPSHGLVDMTPDMAVEFMQNIGYWTQKRLRLIVENKGRATWEYLDEFSNGELNQGFQSGVTRRIRKITQNPAANLLGWREGYDDAGNKCQECGEYFISHTTLDSLTEYFDELDEAE